MKKALIVAISLLFLLLAGYVSAENTGFKTLTPEEIQAMAKIETPALAEIFVLQETKTQIDEIQAKAEQFAEEPKGKELPKTPVKQITEYENVELSGSISARLRHLEDIADIGNNKTLSIIFPMGKAEVADADKKTLDEIAGKYILLIAGYASTSAGNNKEYSLKRASSVADYLYSRGTNIENTKIVGRGPTNIYGDLANNQRVVILYIE